MPELPELEALVRDASPGLIGRRIERFQVHKPKLFSAPPGLSVEGHTIEGLRRRGKYVVWSLSEDVSLVMHLKLAGQIVHVDAAGKELAHGGHPVPMWGSPLPHKATHVVFYLDDGSIVYLTDIRQFARLHLMHSSDVSHFLKKQKIGPEPLKRGFTAAELARKLRRRSIALKPAVMDQSVVGGIGNIYTDEALWKARLHPRRVASSLTDAELARLHRSIRAVLDYAVREGAAFVPQGKAISDRDFPYCHGRAGSPCPRCKKVIVKDYVGGRGTHYCPRCQKLPVA